MKKLLLMCLLATAMTVSGCEYSATQTTESSFSVDANGKVETSASSSVYTERTENGKTVNNSASVSVGNKGAGASANTSTAAQSDEGLSFVAEDADLRKGEAEVSGYFANSGTNPIKINKINISMSFYDEKGKLIWNDETEINNINLTVKPGTKEPATLTIHNPQAPDFKGNFDMKYTMNYS